MRIIPQQPFFLRIDCPPGGGCVNTNANRIKFIEYSENNDVPTWSSTHACRNAQQSTVAVWPDAQPGQNTLLDGGARTDYKYWSAWDGNEADQIQNAPRLRMSAASRVDVCYCNSACTEDSTWFRVGTLVTLTTFAFAVQS